MNRAQRRAYRKGHNMRVNFSKAVEYIPEWNGNTSLPTVQQIKVTLRPMRFEHVMSVMDAMGGNAALAAAQGGSAEELAAQINTAHVVTEIATILPMYAENLLNLDGDEGALSIADISTYPSFMNLAVELLMKLVSISTPTETDEGNSEGQSV